MTKKPPTKIETTCHADQKNFFDSRRGSPLTFDRRRHAVLRDGRVLVMSADIRSDVRCLRRNDDCPETWKVSFSTGFFAEGEIGTTRNGIEASIAAARIAEGSIAVIPRESRS